MSRTPDELLDHAEQALDRGDVDACLAFCQRVLDADPHHTSAHYLRAEALRDVGAIEDAEDAYRAVIQRDPHHSASFSGLGAVLFDQVRFDEARTACLRALRADDGNPEAYYWRAMLRERRSDFRGALRDYRRAYTLDPERFPMPETLDDATVEAIVSDVLLSLHPALRSYLAQVVILLEEVPDADLCLQYDPPAPPGEILGVFSGTSLADRSLDDPWTGLPSSIVLFRRNLERIAWDREKLVDELRITVFHEVGHFLGL
ncbi:MAG: tetratricopeptide repeat protein, partial [Myxococcales bacterium]|nr:tetratricopeptide repeat protein [Myxococcales bacterium]